MNSSDKRRILRGEVFHQGRWMSIDKKCDLEKERQKKIIAGYVFYQGEWMSIDEKIARVVPSLPKEEKKAETIVINQYDNRTIYNVDKRTTHHHEHRHVHIDKEGLEEYMRNRLPEGERDTRPVIDSDRKKRTALSGRKEPTSINDKRNSKGLLPAPEESDDGKDS